MPSTLSEVLALPVGYASILRKFRIAALVVWMAFNF
jgi:hypothetical protein